MAKCEKCGKEFEQKFEWQKICPKCYYDSKKEAGEEPKMSTYAKKAPAAAPVKKMPTVEGLRAKFDEVMAEFAPEIDSGLLKGEDIRAMAIHLNIAK